VVPLAAAIAVASATPSSSQIEITSKDQKSKLRLGILAQLQAESLDMEGVEDDSNNIFLRRIRLISGYELGEELSVFAQLDSPNLGKAGADGEKNNGDVILQDAVATWKFDEAFMLDGGLLLTEQSYNHNQSVSSLLAIDVGPFTFDESTPTDSRGGRDFGLRARGYLFDDHLEYRAALYQGVRGDGASNDFRYAGRVMLQFFSPQVGLFYRGTSLGKTRALNIGAAADKQEDYEAYHADVFFEQPFAGGNDLVLQADYSELDGGDFLPDLPERYNLLVEGGIYIAALRLQPFAQYVERELEDETLVDEERFTLGIAFFRNGHNNNLKLAYTRIDPSEGESGDQIQLQWQVYQF